MRLSPTNWLFRTIAVGCLGAAGLGCSLDATLGIPTTNPPPPVTPTGTLTQRWSIGGRFDARFCATYRADRMQLVVRDQAGRVVAQAFQPCEQLQMSLTLPTGSYSGDVWLIGSDGTPVSTTLTLRPFQIVRGTETFIDTDFPISSLYAGLG